MQKYSPKIDKYVREKQYEKKTFDIELMFKPGDLKVEKGEVIAISGNSGGSAGPHLHFEFRDTKTEMILNPMLFGLDKKVKDPYAPKIMGVVAYPLSDDAVVDGSAKPVLLNFRLQKDGTYLADKINARGKLGFAINASDKATGSTGNNGIYKVQTFYNGSPGYRHEFSSFAFDETRYINHFIDYPRYYSTGQRFQKLFFKERYPLSIVNKNTHDGIYAVTPGETQNYRIEVYDFHGNKAVVTGSIVHSEAPATIVETKHRTPYFVQAKNDHNYTKDNVSVFIPANAFYEDFYMDFDVKDSILYLHDPSVPVHTNITISFDVSHLTKEQLQRTFIAGFNGKKVAYNNSYMQDGRLTAKVRGLGNYKLADDTVAPKIFDINFSEGKWLSDKHTFSVKISDNLSGIGTFDAWLNGKWILMHYDHKKRLLFHNFSDGVVSDGRNDLKITVTDNVGNSTTFETHFFRTQNNASVEKDN